jgi:D-alanyl-D-alanine carboxypeptidase
MVRKVGPALALLAVAGSAVSGSAARSALTTAAASGATRSKINREVQAAVNAIVAAGSPGAAAELTVNGRRRYFTAGVASVSSRQPIGPNDHYRIASQTKPLTAIIVLQLAAEKRLSLSDTVRRWVPGLVPNDRRITIRQLLNMTSGLHEYFDASGAPFVLAVQRYPGLRWQPRQLAAIGAASRPDFPPGARFSYSNTNYELLGIIAEEAGHASLSRLMSLRIFKPLALRQMTYRPDVTALPRPFVSGYYSYENSPPVNVTGTSPTITGPAGAIVATMPDVSRMFRALMSGRLLPARSLQDMITPSRQSVRAHDPYGLGLELNDECGKNYGHAGTFPGYKSATATTRNGHSSFTYVVNSTGDFVKQTPPWPPKILPAINHLRSVLRCAIQGKTAPARSSELSSP